MIQTPTQWARPGSSAAFTRTDLLVVVLMVALFASMLLPVLASGGSKSKSRVCLDNLKRMALAWHLYADDNAGRIVMVFHGSEAQRGVAAATAKNAPWALGWLDWTTNPDNTNFLFLTSDRYSRLAWYLNHSAEPFKCPSDIYISPAQTRKRWTERPRSVSAGVGIGDGNAESGPWDALYKHVRKTSEFLFPSPSETLVYVDEHPDSQNDPAFQYPYPTTWVDQPATYHDGAGSFAFADGHTEMHRWQSSLAQPRANRIKFSNVIDAPAKAGDPDLHWVSYHCSRRSEKSY